MDEMAEMLRKVSQAYRDAASEHKRHAQALLVRGEVERGMRHRTYAAENDAIAMRLIADARFGFPRIDAEDGHA